MEIRNNITPAVLAAATGMLQPFVPELSPKNLVAALREHTEKREIASARPLTRQQAAELLSVCVGTIDRYIKSGMLRRVPVGPRLVRIDPQSVRALLDNTVAPEA